MKRIMTLRDIVFMNITAVLGLRWLSFAAATGASSIFLWSIAALIFFIPLGLVSSELATTWPEEGGLYVWVREAYGEKAGFLVAWLYWVNAFFYLPSMLTFVVVTVAYIINPALAQSKLYITTSVLFALWSVTFLNFRNMGFIKKLCSISGPVGMILPGIIIIVLGFAAVFILKRPIPTDYSWVHWIPNFGSKSNIYTLSVLMFSMAGIELTPIIAGETENPQKTFPIAIFISALIICGIYIVGTVSVTLILSPEKIGSANGLMDSLQLIIGELHLPSIVLIAVALMICIGSIGGISVWMVIPVKMFFESCKDGVLPESFTQLNKNGMPARAIVIQAIITSFILLGSSLLPSVNVLYETLVLMAIITYFIPYLAMFVTFLKLRKLHPDKYRPYKAGGTVISWIISIVGVFAVLLAIILALIIPPADLKTAHDILLFRIEIAFGPLCFIFLGYLIYALYEYRKKRVVNNFVE